MRVPVRRLPGGLVVDGDERHGQYHYQRIFAANPAISGQNYNDAVTSAEMSQLQSQLQRAVDRLTLDEQPGSAR